MTLSKKKKTLMRYLSLILVAISFGSCSKGLPPLRTWELAAAKAGSIEMVGTFVAPIRDPAKGYWDYQLGIVLPANTEFDIAGETKVYKMTGELATSFRFDSATKSSWLGEKDRASHLLSGRLAVIDGQEYRVELVFDRPLNADTSLVLHFLSHTDTPIQTIEEDNKAEMATPRKLSD